MGTRRVRPRLGRWVLSAALALVAVLPVTPAEAHILLQDGTSGDVFQDMPLNFAVPLIVLAIGAVAGIVLSRRLGRGDDAADDEVDEADAPIDGGEAERAVGRTSP